MNDKAMQAALQVLEESGQFTDVQRQAIAQAIRASLDQYTWMVQMIQRRSPESPVLPP